MTSQSASPPRASSSRRLEPLRHIDGGVLNVGYYEAGPADGPAVILLHGFPYDIHSYVDVVPLLAAQGCRVIVPYLRGYGPTRFRDPATPRSGEQASVGADLIALMDALSLKRAVFAGYDWGGRAACIGAALWPDRCIGLVSVNGYLIQDIARAMIPAKPEREVPLWYQYYFQVERGRAGLSANRRGIARVLCSNGRRTGILTMPALSGPRRRTTILTMSTSLSTATVTASASLKAIRDMPTSSSGWRRCRSLRCLPSRWTAMPTASRAQPTAPRRQRNFPVRAPIA